MDNRVSTAVAGNNSVVLKTFSEITLDNERLAMGQRVRTAPKSGVSMERITTGIKGFDDLMEGGFPKGSTILLAGGPGTGKTIFALQYLCDGAAKGENGIYVVVDSGFAAGLALLKEQARELGIDIEKYVQEGKITFLVVPLDQRKFNIFETITEIRESTDAKRVVFDSLSTFITNLDLFSIPIGYAGMTASSVEGSAANAISAVDVGGHISYQSSPEKRLIYLALEMLRKQQTTNLVVSYSNMGPEGQITSDGVSEFACDGLIVLKSASVGDTLNRTIEIVKMRATKISGGIKSYEIGQGGLNILG